MMAFKQAGFRDVHKEVASCFSRGLYVAQLSQVA